MNLDTLLDIPLNTVPVRHKPTGKIRKLFKHLHDNDYSLEMDWSSIESAVTCDRSAEYRLVRSRSTYPSPPLIYGQAIHSALEVFYKHGMVDSDAVRALMLQAGETVFLKSPVEQGQWRNFEHFTGSISRYMKKYAGQEPFEVVMHDDKPCVELSFATPLGVLDVNAICPYPKSMVVVDSDDNQAFQIDRVHLVWTGLIDLVVKQNDQFFVLDHKTASRTGESYWRQYELSQQVVGYVWAANQLFNIPFSGVIMNVIVGRAPTKTGTAWALERETKYYPAERVASWRLNMITILEDFMHHLTQGFFPMKTQWCSGKFGVCPYLDVCCMATQDQQLQLLMSEMYAPNVWNPIDNGETE